MKRIHLSILLNLVAIAAPAAVLFYTFGADARVDPQSAKDLLYLLGSALFAFCVGLASNALLKGGDSPAVSLIEGLLSRRPGKEAKPEAV
ncbi:MAG TPA: hypothetical protein VLQ45_21430 [Thermoanaerobaculia bacterium]|jgi:hypothetical protein|nr:hypothetical protein [Thermoanaerobaculia bacterium]HSK79030.1 hypothetical protein [Thermoanaerobaculia bacterium]HSN89361.1 hypothetical protein [Thermoanaerobaculia bacterium]